MNHTFQQVRGSAIGNQISPVLANITVSHVEHQWRTQPQIQLLLQQFSDRIYITRYVDNRLVLIDKSQQHHAGIRHFLTDTFYEPPVLLEQEPDLSFLAAQSTLIVRPYPTYNQPTLGNSNLLLQQHQSNTNYQQHSAGFAWLLDTATHVNKQKMMLSP